MKSSGGMCSPFVSKNISAKLVYAFWELENFLMRTWLHIMESFLKETDKTKRLLSSILIKTEFFAK